MTKSVFITGSDGFIGSHLVEHCVHEGYSVRAYVLYNSLESWGWLDTLPTPTLDAIDVIPGDIRDAERVRKAMHGCNAVLHLAALIGIPYSYVAPESYVDVNIKGTLNVLQASRDLGLEKVVHISTSEVYGTAQFVPITEDHPVVGQSPYSASKIAADQIALSFFHSFGTPVAIARPFNTYGPRQSARAVIPTVISQLAAGRKTVTLGAVHPTRDFNFVQDTVSGMMAVLNSPAAVGEIVNLGSGFEISILNTAKLIGEVMGKEIAVESHSDRMRPEGSEVERLCADNTKARNMLGWEPRFAGHEGLKEGLRLTSEWFLEANNLRNYRPERYSI